MAWAIIISPLAREDLRECAEYIAQFGPTAAKRYCGGLIRTAEESASNPLLGRMSPEFGDPEIRDIVFRNHRVVYRAIEDRKVIEIARFWHGARGYLPDDLDKGS